MSNQPIHSPARVLRGALPWIGAGLLLVALPAFAGQVYQWKDANGVTHYSDSPPAGQNYQNRDVRDTSTPAAPTAAKPVVNANCSNARSNLTVLQGQGQVGVDENKDGKADRNLTAEERTNRTAMAEAAVKTYCGASTVSQPASAPPAAPRPAESGKY